MQVEQRIWTQQAGWETITHSTLEQPAQLVIVFGSRKLLSDSNKFEALRQKYPQAHILMNTTAGEIYDSCVVDDTLVVTAIHFEHTGIKVVNTNVNEVPDSRMAGKLLSDQLDKTNLSHVFVISDGLKVNGSELVIGLHANIPAHVPVTGGLAGDGSEFQQTLVGINSPPQEGNIVVIGLYSARLLVGYGSVGGWDAFGPERIITKASSNILYELDNQSALDLYKTYLGDEAKGLPSTGLLFPLTIQTEDSEHPIVRTILAIDEEAKTMTFAGDMPEGAVVRLMKANFESLIAGAGESAEHSLKAIHAGEAKLAICISCVGRKLVLGQRIDEEVEEVRDILGESAVITGFYSYGEISPFLPNAKCELHNQTMTITVLAEK